MSAPTQGLLLVNLGTPTAPEPGPVRAYLREFLSDPRVLDIGAFGRWALLNLVILPFRPAKSAAAYKKVWTADGSPLLVHGHALARAVQAQLGDTWKVELAMRYGEPALGPAIERFYKAGIDQIVVFPLYPHHAASSTGSTLARVFELAREQWVVPSLRVVPPFYDHPAFIDAFAAVARPVLADFRPDHVVMSFHGLPERHMKKGDPTGMHCLSTATCCDTIGPANRTCYRAQCLATARALADAVDVPAEQLSVAFQSRLGRTPWIKPYTDQVLPELVKAGKKRVAVFCPAFVADCLETLEEIAIRARDEFTKAGGEDLVLIPSLNASPRWVDAVATLAKGTAAGLPVVA